MRMDCHTHTATSPDGFGSAITLCHQAIANHLDRKSTRLNSSHLRISVAGVPLMNVVFEVDESPYIYHDTRFIYDNEDYVWGGLQTYQDFYMHNVLRSKYVQVCFESSGVPFQLTRFTLETVPVGVVS